MSLLTATCRHCGRRIVDDPQDGWVDPEADGDDRIWRETCDENHEDRIAAHEPKDVHLLTKVGGAGGTACGIIFTDDSVAYTLTRSEVTCPDC